MGGGSRSGNGGNSSVIRDFVKKNPNFMKLNATQRNEMLMEVQLQAKQKEIMMRKGSNGGFRLPGTSGGEAEMSESYKHTIEKMMEKKFQDRKIEILKVKPVHFNGGRIDSEGRIYDQRGKKVGQINLTNSEITLGGSKLGKYDPKGPSVGQIKRFVNDHNKRNYGMVAGGMVAGRPAAPAAPTTPQNNCAWFFGEET